MKDRFPITICKNCLVEINRFYKFRKLVLQSDKILNEIIKIQNVEIFVKNDINFVREIKPLFTMEYPIEDEYNVPGNDSTDPLSLRNPSRRYKKNVKDIKENDLVSKPSESIILEKTQIVDISDNANLIEDEVEIIENGTNNITNEKNFLEEEIEINEYELQMIDNLDESSEEELEINELEANMIVNADQKKISTVEKNLSCDKCSFVAASRKSLRYHREIHSEFNNYLCNICGMTFKTTTTFSTHLKKHDPNNKSKCTTCGKAFGTPFHLRMHILVHTKEKPFKCELCDLRCSQKSSLNVSSIKNFINIFISDKYFQIIGAYENTHR